MTTRVVLAALFVLTFEVAHGQVDKTDYKERKSFAIQTDVFDLVAKGFSIGGSYTFNHNRIFVATGRNELPDLLNSLSDKFYEKREFFIQAGYYRFLKKSNGLFVGIETIFQQMKISSKTTNESVGNPVLRIAPLVGYEWMPIKSIDQFTITPWMSERLPLYSKAVNFPLTGNSYKTADFNFVMGLNVGYRF